MRVIRDGALDPRIANDPRWSKAQHEAAVKAANVDHRAEVLGLDAKMRPVLRANVGAGPTTYALLRNGAPAKPVGPMAESWRRTPRRAD